ncbi:MAG: hypothetical protein GX288_04140 [Clostridiales bacterium]|jgi:hypothetical protein|nr:hypothetical protein [Clostridiales bacterium]
MNDNKAMCKKCLLSEIAPEEYIANMRIYLNGINDNLKASEELYQSRLDKCKQCDNLIEGLCRICGCFVEYRAAIKSRQCPAIHPQW